MTNFRTVLFCLAGFPVLLAAQQNSPCDERTIPVNVVDGHGQQILGLTSEQFRASLQGQPLKVLSAKFENGPQRILILVDTSGSVSFDARQWELVKSVAGDIISAGPARAELALATFSDKVEPNTGFGQGREAVRGAILNLKPPNGTPRISGGTALNDAILEAAGMFGNPQPGDAVYAITDGIDTESKNKTGKVLQYLESRRIRLFVSVIHNDRFVQFPGPSGRVEGAEIVEHTARESGGYYTVLEADGSKQATSGVRQLYSLMASFYLLDIELPKDPDKPRELKLAVTDVNGNEKKGMLVLHPQNIFPCASTR